MSLFAPAGNSDMVWPHSKQSCGRSISPFHENGEIFQSRWFNQFRAESRPDVPAIALGIRGFVGGLCRDNRQSWAHQTLGAAQQVSGALDRVFAALDQLILEGFACPRRRGSGLAHSALPYSDGSAFVVSQPLMVSSGGGTSDLSYLGLIRSPSSRLSSAMPDVAGSEPLPIAGRGSWIAPHTPGPAAASGCFRRAGPLPVR